MAAYGKVEEFNSEQSWDVYVERLSFYYEANKRNNIARRCGRKVDSNRREVTQPKSRVHCMDSSTEEAAPDSEMSRYGDYTSMECGNVKYDRLHHTSSSGAFTCTVEMGGTKVDMEIDTGASCSVISQKVYDSLESRPPLLRSLRTIKTFTGETVPLVGEADIIVRYRGRQKLLRVVVTKSGPSLLGRNWLEQLKLNWAEIKQLKMHSCPEAAVLADL